MSPVLRTAAFVMCSGVCLSGCSNSEIAIFVLYLDRDLGERAQVVELSLLEDCVEIAELGDPPASATETVSFQADAVEERFAVVREGSYGLYARLFNSDCEIVGAGCENKDIESRDNYVSVMTAPLAEPRPGCAEASCHDGFCAEAGSRPP